MASKRSGRKLVEIAQVARGKTPLKYELEVVPFFAGELPSGLEKVCFTWERGSKIFMTQAEAVNPHTKAVFWQQFLRQASTMYKQDGRILPKEFSFKIQHVRGSGAEVSRKTIGKIKVDMSQFCSEDTAPVPQEVFLQLKPAGKLKVSVKATWLKDAKVDVDALTELSFGTHRSTEAGEAYEVEDEQDLSGFDNLEEALAFQRNKSHAGGNSSSSPNHSIPAYRGAADSSSISSSQAASTSAQGKAAAASSESPRSSKAGTTGSKLKPAGLQVAGSVAPFSVGLSPQAEAERAAWLAEERARQEAFQQAESAKMRRTIEENLRLELNDVLAKRSFSWRSIFCCCWPQQTARLRTTQELASMQTDDNQLLTSAPLPL